MSDANEPAHPCFTHEKAEIHRHVGLTKREYMASLAMLGLLPNYEPSRTQAGDEALAALAVRQADALLAELSR